MEKRKRSGKMWLVSVLAATMAFSGFSFSPGAAASFNKDEVSKIVTAAEKKEEITKEEAIRIVKEFMEIPDSYKLESTSFSSNWYPKRMPVWRINWVERQGDYKPVNQLSFVVDAEKGYVISMDHYRYTDEPASFPPKVSTEEAQKIAETYVQKNLPEFFDKVKVKVQNTPDLIPLDGRVFYDIVFERVVHDNILFPENFIRVNVNGNGEITSVYFHWDYEISFPDVEHRISSEEAEKLLKETLAVQMTYIRPWRQEAYGQNDSESSPIYFGYRYPATGQYYVDAKSGVLRDMYGEEKDVPAIAEIKPLVDQPKADEPAPLPQEITSEQAVDIVTSEFSINGDLVMQDTRYYDSWGRDKISVWMINWEARSEDSQYFKWVRAVVDASTGQILEFYNDGMIKTEDSGDTGKDEEKISYDEAKKIAIKSIEKLSPHLMHQVYIDDSMNNHDLIRAPEQHYFLYFKRIVNGLSLDDQGIRVGVNAKSGELTSFAIDWDKKDYPVPPEGLMSKEQALDLILQDVNVELTYFQPYPRYDATGELDKEQSSIYLVYRMISDNRKGAYFIDAQSGQWRSLETGEYFRGDEIPQDIEGHWAQKELELMYRYNAFEMEDGLVHPDEAIKRGELIKMLVLAVHQGNYYPVDMNQEAAFKDVASDSKYFSYVQTAVARNWIDTDSDTFNPEASVDREELAVLITRALGYGSLADTEGIFYISFEDRDQIKETGHVAIVSGLGIMKGDGQRFHPDQTVSRAQAAVAFYRFLEARAKMRSDQTPTF